MPWYGEQQLGGESTLAFDVGAALRLADDCSSSTRGFFFGVAGVAGPTDG